MDSVDEDLIRFRRFLVIGSESNYLVGGLSCSDGAPECLHRLIESEKGAEAVQEILAVQDVPQIKPAPSLLSLAMCARSSVTDVKQAAYDALGRVCQTPAQLFAFINFAKNMTDSKKGWGRALRRSVSKWYNTKDPLQLAVLTTRYKSSAGWTHIDLLRLSHTKPANPGVGVVMKYLLKGLSAAMETASEELAPLIKYLQAVDTVKHSTDQVQVALLIRQHEIYKEHIPTKLLNSSEVWCALMERMTSFELLANIGKIASVDNLKATCPTMSLFVQKIQDERSLINHRVLPMMVLTALRIYEQGKGKWSKSEEVIASLNNSYSLVTSKLGEKINKRVLIGVHLSSDPAKSSVRGSVQLSPLLAAAGLVHGLMQVAKDSSVVSFLSEVQPLHLSSHLTLADVCKKIKPVKVLPPVDLCQCDLSSPLMWAEQQRQKYDVVVLLSDGRQPAGDVTAALNKYRASLQVNTRLIVCGLTSQQIDGDTALGLGSLQITGFDSSVPYVINSFARGHI